MLNFYGTLGPACRDENTLRQMFQAGMTGARLNLSHGRLEDRGEWIAALHGAAQTCGVPARLLIDLQGPELRVGDLEPILLKEQERVCFGRDGIPVPAVIFSALERGMEVLLDDGKLCVQVDEPGRDFAQCRVLRGGWLCPRKSVALPGVRLEMPTLTGEDLENLAHAVEFGVTGVMLPFVRRPQDLITLRAALDQIQGASIEIFAKIENRTGADMLPELLPYTDEVVIARGDLGNDMPLWELPGVQKKIAALCREQGKRFMVVTQMLYTMEHAAVPTRAEVSDIFNAVLDGAASLMLTGETAVGEYPIEAMTYLCRTAEAALRTL